jgi:hypothetical protein
VEAGCYLVFVLLRLWSERSGIAAIRACVLENWQRFSFFGNELVGVLEQELDGVPLGDDLVLQPGDLIF